MKHIKIIITNLLYLNLLLGIAVHAGTSSSLSGNMHLEPVFNAKGFPDLPGLVGMYQAPNSSKHWYAVLRDGEIHRFENHNSVKKTEVFMSLNDVKTRSEMGLLSMAFHPNYAKNGYFYVYYNDATNNGASTISRFTSKHGQAVNTNTEHVLLTVDQPAANHNGGDIKFGADGYLYISLGDGGAANDKFNHGQNRSSLLGTLLRIDVNSQSGKKTYGIPASNPFIGDKRFPPETYAWGLRNVWRFSFDKKTDALWAADVGQNKWEEVNIIQAGDNLGWPIFEGNACFRDKNCKKQHKTRENEVISELVAPVSTYAHGKGDCSVTGGYVYRGTRYPSLQGSYLMGDYCSGTLRRVYQDQQNAGKWLTEIVAQVAIPLTSFAEGNDGELYVLSLQGDSGKAIYQLKLDQE